MRWPPLLNYRYLYLRQRTCVSCLDCCLYYYIDFMCTNTSNSSETRLGKLRDMPTAGDVRAFLVKESHYLIPGIVQGCPR